MPQRAGQWGAPVTPACMGHPDQFGFKPKKYRVGIWISPCDDSDRSCLMVVNFKNSHHPLPPRMPEQTGTVILALAVGKWGQREGADSARAGARLPAALLLLAGTRPLQPLILQTRERFPSSAQKH